MAKNYDERAESIAQGLGSGLNKSRPESRTVMAGKHSHWAKGDTHDRADLMLDDGGAELNMPHHVIVVADD